MRYDNNKSWRSQHTGILPTVMALIPTYSSNDLCFTDNDLECRIETMGQWQIPTSIFQLVMIMNNKHITVRTLQQITEVLYQCWRQLYWTCQTATLKIDLQNALAYRRNWISTMNLLTLCPDRDAVAAAPHQMNAMNRCLLNSAGYKYGPVDYLTVPASKWSWLAADNRLFPAMLV